ncbi:hypothetical protein INQ43_10700 [Lysobacter sp. H23M47]|nr:hypothetical protein INQ43_10700 [Lysobacter sp. H23M47]
MRFHDVSKLMLLERAIQSLHAQVGVVLQPIIVTQRFTMPELEILQAAVRRQWYFSNLPTPQILNLDDGSAHDARSDLLNMGVQCHLQLGNRYLGFLDYDDVMYTHAYRTLVGALNASGAALAFATVEVANVVSLKDYEFVYGLTKPYRGRNKLDLIKENFCPLHSYLLDCSRLNPEELYFRADLNRLEDYDFLLRVAGSNPCDFSKLGTSVGLYVMRSDGTNSTPHGDGPVTLREQGTHWKDSAARLGALRSTYEVRFFACDF